MILCSEGVGKVSNNRLPRMSKIPEIQGGRIQC